MEDVCVQTQATFLLLLHSPAWKVLQGPGQAFASMFAIYPLPQCSAKATVAHTHDNLLVNLQSICVSGCVIHIPWTPGMHESKVCVWAAHTLRFGG